ncbi:MAG TPA: ribosome-associated translation inhibitor RaiA [Verrucomicrobiota bacterium]|jgi:putative sigma-54 modulation protein|nr:ribosome-associated translation inhibitor RaiA [Verrucomicrobiota bacterium]
MKVIITSHNLKATEAIEAHVNKQLGKLDRLIPNVLAARVNLENDTSKLHIPCKCLVRLEIPGNDLIAEDSHTDMYTAIDNVAKKLAQQARKRQGKSITVVKRSSNTSEVERMLAKDAKAASK